MSKTTDNLMARLKAAHMAEAGKDAATERAAMEAIGRTQSRLLRETDEDARAELFANFERAASARDRKLIAAHPLRPAATDALHAAASVPPKPSNDKPAGGATPDEAPE